MSEKVKVRLVGVNGNVFNLVGICTRALKCAGQPEEAKRLQGLVFASASYDEALVHMMEVCDVE